MKVILIKKEDLFSYFHGPNTHFYIFALIKKRKFWFNKIIFEDKSLHEVIRYAETHGIHYEDHTINQINHNSARPKKVN